MMFHEFHRMINQQKLLFLLIFYLVGNHVIYADEYDDSTSLVCNETGIILTFNRTALEEEATQPWDITFLGQSADSDCTTNSTLSTSGTEVTFNLLPSQCGINTTESGGFLIYSQDVLVTFGTGPAPLVSTYALYCSKNYTLDEDLSLFNVTRRQDGSTSREGSIDSPEIAMTHKDNIGVTKPEYKLGEIVEIELQLQESAIVNLTLYPRKCYATTESAGGGSSYDLITDGCKSDTTTTITRVSNSLVKFTFQAFRFIDASNSAIYMHCSTFTCLPGSLDSRCNDCDSKKRKRRSIITRDDGTMVYHSSVFHVARNSKDDFRVNHHKRNKHRSISSVEMVLLLLLLTLMFVFVMSALKWLYDKNWTRLIAFKR